MGVVSYCNSILLMCPKNEVRLSVMSRGAAITTVLDSMMVKSIRKIVLLNARAEKSLTVAVQQGAVGWNTS